MTNPARVERQALCDTLEAVGPDAPTLCEGWTTRDLAAHLVLRESRPDAAPGIVIDALAGYTARVQQQIADRPWPQLVGAVRGGPPMLSPTRLDAVDRLANSVEYFVHHEDIRRAQPGWEPRALPADLEEALADALRRSARLLARRAPVGVELLPTGQVGGPITARKGASSVLLRAPAGELVLYLYGRQDHARVDADGNPSDVEALATARFGL